MNNTRQTGSAAKLALRLSMTTVAAFSLSMCTTLEAVSGFPGGKNSKVVGIFDSDNAANAAGASPGNSTAADWTGTSQLASDRAVGKYGSDGRGNSYFVSYAGLSDKQVKLMDSALSLLGKNELNVRGRRFTLDCTGVVMAAYWGAGFDLQPAFNRESGNGVRRLHDLGKNRGSLVTSHNALPEVGDIIIWDDTYDMDGNGRWGDPFTHDGLVVAVEPNGQITYLHHNYADGIVLARMNLRQPEAYKASDGKTEINSPMRQRSDRHIKPESWLSSHLFRAYARVLPLF